MVYSHLSGRLVQICVIVLIAIGVFSNPTSHLNPRNCGFQEKTDSNFSIQRFLFVETPDNLTIGWGDTGHMLKWSVNSTNQTTYGQYAIWQDEDLIDSGTLQLGLVELNVTVGWLGVGTHEYMLALDWHEGDDHFATADRVYVKVTASPLLIAAYSFVGVSVGISAVLLLRRLGQ